jgi:hypothetical protein
MAAPLNSSRPSRDLEGNSAAEQLAALTAELQQRDQLIETLTERLEEAAEQLDRIHRSGGDRGGRGGPAAMPAEALEYLYSVAERTDQMVGEWAEVQAAHVLNRLDARIESLLETLRGDGGRASSGYTPPTSFLSTSSPASNAPPPAPPAHEAGAVESPAALEEEQLVELKDPPALVSDSELDPSKLHTAIRDREDYISYLISELRRRHPRHPVDWSALQNAPEELLTRLQNLERRLQSELQKEELALSLERARMARERNELEKIKSRLEKEIRLLGAPAPKEPEPAPTRTGADETGGLRKLFSRKK